MNGFIPWIAAQAEPPDPASNFLPPEEEQHDEQPPDARRSGAGDIHLEDLPAHQFPPRATDAPQSVEETAEPSPPEGAAREDNAAEPLDRNPDLWLYRDRTIALLRRYLRYSLETGRLPSILGREIFRATVTSYSATTFEDRVLFAHDVENCLQRLDRFSQQVLARIVLQEHGHEEAARLLHCSRRTLERELLAAIDALSRIFLEVGILQLNLAAGSRGPREV